jgi:tetratricopeptide (TPR) repeat protein
MKRIAAILFLVLLVNTAYLASFASPTVFYMANVLLHIGLGAALLIALVWVARAAPAATGLLLFAAVLGLVLCVRGNVQETRWAFWSHIAFAAAGVLLLLPWVQRQPSADFRRAFHIILVVLALAPASSALYRKAFPNPHDRIRNPDVVPASMEEEGGGPKSPFFPSSARTNVGGIIPANFFMDSETCGECHKDIYQQWRSSAHRFASFNNQFYRKSIEYMQDVVGTKPSKWCAGCHDHAVFFNGRFEKPIREQIDTPEAHAGLACTSCHSIVHVDSSMGNGGFTIEYPPLHELATSRNPFVRSLDRFLTYVEPAPHRRAFMKPFMRQDSAEFCSTCHKVHLDVPVNSYRWFRGFNDYDTWQASGVSGQGARSFYYPAKSQTCTDCHMPLVPSRDPGHHNGFVHSHRFPAANMAVAYVNKDEEQMRVTENFLKSGFISVDIFSVSPVEERKGEPAMIRRTGESPPIMTGFGIGEEAMPMGDVVIRDPGRVAAPIDRGRAAVRPGSTVRVDVVVRTRKIGHFFPGGTVDAFDVWLEMQAKDAAGKTIFWSGKVEDNGRGPVERGAHFYRALQLDGAGNPIDKRNACQARSVLYVRLIPPGAADVAHFRMRIPPDARGPLTLTAKLNYRKFAHSYTQFAYAGKPKPDQPAELVSAHHNSQEFSFDARNIPANVSGQIKGEIPNLPIVTLAEAQTRLQTGEPNWQPAVHKEDRERWNDWGIGLLLQGDIKGAEYAFQRVTEADPGYADGWLNVARALIQEGETGAAQPYLRKALELDSSLGRIHFFQGMVEKAEGDYDAALASLRRVAAQYPRDRVVQNQVARVLFLKRDYRAALQALEKVREVDPEDVQMHYTAMLCYRGLGDHEQAAREEKLFRRFKAEESSQSITERPRLLRPEDNNERQMIHEHESAP